MTGAALSQDELNADTILKKGWRQGSVFDPRLCGFVVPDGIKLQVNEWLIVCTQSCSVVSTRFSVDPNVELMVVTPLKKYSPRAPEATGKNVRKLHISFPAGSTAVAIECDSNRRFFCERHLLLQMDPSHDMPISQENSAKLAAWLGRAYTRIALPNALVARMQITLLKAVSSCLEIPYGEDLKPVHANVPLIYLKWVPNDEDAEVYELSFQFICNEHGAIEVLDEALIAKLAMFNDDQVCDGLILKHFECKRDSETFLTDLDGYDRFSEWDYLSNLADVVNGIG